MGRFKAGVLIGFGFCVILISVSPILLYVLGEALENPGPAQEKLMRLLSRYEGPVRLILEKVFDLSRGIYREFRMDVGKMATHAAAGLLIAAISMMYGLKSLAEKPEKPKRKRTPRICRTCKYWINIQGGICTIYGPKKPDEKACKRWRKK